MQPVQFFKCLADETRLRLLLMLQQEELCVCELMGALQQSQPKISRHLAQLRACGLLQDRREGQWVFYRISPGLPEWASEVLSLAAANNRQFLQENITNLSAMGDRPVRKKSCC